MENHKRLFTAALVTSVVALTVSALSLFFLFTITSRLDELNEGALRIGVVLSSLTDGDRDEEQIFILREFEGAIGIYNSAGVLTDVIDVSVRGLPEADREMLKVGIYAYSRSELMALIEDYTG